MLARQPTTNPLKRLRAWSTFLRTGQSSRLGVASLETALLIPFIFLFMLFAMQLGLILLSHQVTQYAAFMAARSHQVYGNKTLGAIKYPNSAESLNFGSQGDLLTNDAQTTAEATAERILFESLPWEHDRITVTQGGDSIFKRLYRDGNDTEDSVNNGSVRVTFTNDPQFHSLAGVRVTYCMPVLFAGLDKFFSGNFSSEDGEANPCSNTRGNNSLESTRGISTIPISQAFFLGREP